MTAGTPAARGGSPTTAALAYGIPSRILPKPYLNMPHRADGKIPRLLSQTGAYSVTRDLIPGAGLIPYDIVVPFWSDGAAKLRWVAVPDAKIKYSATGDWNFPNGTVFVKTFELPTDAGNPGARRRLETRLLVRDSSGGVYGVLYKWRADNSDADLLEAGATEPISVKAADGEVRKQTWDYPSRQDCLTCHNRNTSGVLGVKARQMNRMFAYPSGVADNEIRAWNHIGLFDAGPAEADLGKIATLAPAGDATRSVQDRARSYLDANCSHCHRPGGTVAYFDARYDTPIEKQQIIDGAVLIDQGIDRPRVVSPHDVHAGRHRGRHQDAAACAGDHRSEWRQTSARLDHEPARPFGSGAACHVPRRRYVQRAGRRFSDGARTRSGHSLYLGRKRPRTVGPPLRQTHQTRGSCGGSRKSIQGGLHAKHHLAGSIHHRKVIPIPGRTQLPVGTTATDQGLIPALTRAISLLASRSTTDTSLDGPFAV
jgi:hypothetical protein